MRLISLSYGTNINFYCVPSSVFLFNVKSRAPSSVTEAGAGNRTFYILKSFYTDNNSFYTDNNSFYSDNNSFYAENNSFLQCNEKTQPVFNMFK